MERWLTQRLSVGLGICANVEFPFPRRLTGDAVAAASGIDPDDGPVAAGAAGVAAAGGRRRGAAGAVAGAARRHLRPTARAGSRAVRHLADLFDRYALHRPDIRAGRRRGRHWQAELWRRLRERIPEPDPAARVEAPARGCAREPERRRAARSASRCSGSRGCPPASCSVLRALAEHRDVHLFLLHPSPALWERIAAAAPRVTRRAEDPTARCPRNRLLASWGQDSRELQLVLGPGRRRARAPGRAPRPARCSPGCRPRCARTGRRSRARTDAQHRGPRLPRPRAPGRGRARRDPAPARGGPDARAARRDRDVPGHRGVRAADPGDVRRRGDRRREDELERPACPTCASGSPTARCARRTRCSASSRGCSSSPAQRLTASQVLDLADREPVRRRFRLDDDDARAARGLGRRERHPLGPGRRAPRAVQARRRCRAGTWRAGLDRLLRRRDDERGRAAAVRRRAAAGRRRERRDRPRRAPRRARRPAAGRGRLAAAAPQTRAGVGGGARRRGRRADRDRAARARGSASELQRLLDDVVDEAAGPRRAARARPEIRALLADRLQGRPTRANFRTGHLTICTLVPMRSVPHRVVCLLGLDDGDVPAQGAARRRRPAARRPARRRPRLAHRGPPAAARRAAGRDRPADHHLHRQRRAHEHRAPAGGAGRASCSTSSGRDVRRRAPAAAVRPAQLRRGGCRGKPWSFDRVTLEGARALAGERARAARRSCPRRCRRASPARSSSTTSCASSSIPSRAFLRQRLGISVGDYSDEVGDALPVELDALERWGVGERLLDALIAARTGRDRDPGRDRRAASSRRASSACPVVQRDLAGRGRDRAGARGR